MNKRQSSLRAYLYRITCGIYLERHDLFFSVFQLANQLLPKNCGIFLPDRITPSRKAGEILAIGKKKKKKSDPNQFLFVPRMYVCMVITYSRVWINRVRLPVRSWSAEQGKLIFLCPRTCLRIWSRETGCRPIPRQPAHLHTQAKSGAYSRNSSRVPRRRPFIYLNRHTTSGQCRVYGSRNCVPMAFTAESPPAQGSYVWSHI